MENMVHTVWPNTHKPYNEYQQRWDTGPKKVKTASPHLVALSLVILMCMHGQRTMPPGTKRFCFILLKMYWEPGNFADNNGARFIVSPFKWSGRFDCCVVLGGFLCLFRYSFHPTGPVWTTLRSIPDLKHRLQRLLLSWWCAQLDPKKKTLPTRAFHSWLLGLPTTLSHQIQGLPPSLGWAQQWTKKKFKPVPQMRL